MTPVPPLETVTYMGGSQLTVAELIGLLSKLPQDAKVWVNGDYATHFCEGVTLDGGKVYLEIG